MRRAVAVLLLPVVGTACSAAPAARGARPAPEAAVSTLFDAGGPYGAMGMLVAAPPLPFVATVHYLAAATPDSTLAVFALSLANHALTFQRDGRGYAAQYHVEVSFRGDTGSFRQFATDETVRVRTFQETERADESIIYQQSLTLHPGVYRVAVTLRDRNGTGVAHVERADTAPRVGGEGLSTPIAVYQGPGRTHLTDVPAFLANPRATVSYGADSLRFYVEAYGARRGTRLAARALDQTGRELWHDTLGVTGTDTLASTLAVLHPSDLPVGQGRLEVAPVDGRPDAARSTPFLISFSDQFAITSYDQMISLLRYFERQDWVERLRQATPAQRPVVWRAFYTAKTDSISGTPVREAMEAYFRRVVGANLRFRETGEPGWLTDRGEVFVTLGEPDDVFDFSSDVSRAGVRGIRWTYNALRLTLFFQDQAGFGRFRLTPLSRAEFQRAVAQVRRRR